MGARGKQRQGRLNGGVLGACRFEGRSGGTVCEPGPAACAHDERPAAGECARRPDFASLVPGSRRCFGPLCCWPWIGPQGGFALRSFPCARVGRGGRGGVGESLAAKQDTHRPSVNPAPSAHRVERHSVVGRRHPSAPPAHPQDSPASWCSGVMRWPVRVLPATSSRPASHSRTVLVWGEGRHNRCQSQPRCRTFPTNLLHFRICGLRIDASSQTRGCSPAKQF